MKEVDFVVIGGGSGGMAAAKEAACLGASVICFDFVKPSEQGTKWGLGGTCVNVGCVPKKLYHHAGNIGYMLHQDAVRLGYSTADDETLAPQIRYERAVEQITNYIRKLNFAYRNGLKSAQVEYINAHANLTADKGVVAYYKGNKGEPQYVKAKFVLLATGGRPTPSPIPGANLAINSDDLFWRREAPGKSLVVGGSYIALECAGYLTHMGFDITVAVRSMVLRGFDRQCAEKIHNAMAEQGTKFLNKVQPVSLESLPDVDGQKQIKVTFDNGTTDVFNTVMFAIGRASDVKGLHLAEANVTVDTNFKVSVNDRFETSQKDIYAVGDIITGAIELTPVAIRQGEHVARLLFSKDSASNLDWKENVATTVFTPSEYGAVGLSEEDAIAKYGEDNIEVYLNEFGSLESSAAGRTKVESMRQDEFDEEQTPNSLAKLVCLRGGDEKVLGIHFVGENAGEVIQGFAVAMKTGNLLKRHFNDTTGIHPTSAEAFCTLDITRRSGIPFLASGGCGGGKCG